MGELRLSSAPVNRGASGGDWVGPTTVPTTSKVTPCRAEGLDKHALVQERAAGDPDFDHDGIMGLWGAPVQDSSTGT